MNNGVPIAAWFCLDPEKWLSWQRDVTLQYSIETAQEIEPDNYLQIKPLELLYMDINNLFLGFVAMFLKLKNVTYSALQSSLPV